MHDIFFHTAVQIMFVKERQHWIATSLTSEEVRLYDSYYNGRLPPSLELQLVQLYQQAITDTGLVVTVVPIQQQRETNNCGLFSIAAAVHVASGEDVGSIIFDESQMRSHLISCFEKAKVSPFPIQSAAKQPPVKRARSSHIVIPVNCECRLPDSKEEMVACDQCDKWYHFTCAGFDVPPPGDWFCQHCI